MEQLHLLIVDDDEEVSDFMKLRIGHDAKHFVIDCVYSAEDCLKFIQKNKVDCVLCDYQMPSMDGMEILLHAKEKGLDAPFIFVTGQGNEELAREAFKNGVFDYFTKEIGFAHFARIINSVEQAVQKKRAERARVRAEEAIKKQLAAMEASMDGMALCDADGKYIYLNRAHADIYGYTVDELIGKTWHSLYCQEDLSRFEKEVAPILRSEGRWRGECVGNKKDGSHFPQELSLVLMEDGGVACIVRDVSERKNLEQQKADLFAMVSHDIKSPLTAIMGYADMLLRETEEDRETFQMINCIRNSCKKINGIMEDFLTLSHLESVKSSLRELACDLTALLREAERDFSIQALGMKLHFQVKTEPGLPMIKVDKTFLQRALFNLVQNAFTYTQPGGEITVAAALGPGEKEINLSVRDTGPGIPLEEQEKVFEKYYRYGRNLPGTKGNGLGLYIVKSVAEAHGGRVNLESEPGKGCVFSIILPAN
ncbi:MAG: ATP-binding protein [Nitrospirota bacterium]